MPILAPITGNNSVTVGLTSTLSCATSNGSWSSSNTAIATVGAGNGIVTGVAQGVCSIIYTVGVDSISITFGVTTRSLSNGFDINQVYNTLNQRIKWQYLGAQSQSGRYYEDFHTLCNPDLIKSLMPSATGKVTDAQLSEYLQSLARISILEMVNAVYNAPATIDPAMLCFYRGDWVLYPQPVANQHQFVGLKLLIAKGDYAMKMNTVELFFNKDCTFNLYLYNDMTLPPIYSIEVSALANQQVYFDLSNDAILNYITTNINKGGTFYFGYYQDDIEAQGAKAMYYSIAMQQFKPCRVWAFSSPMTETPQGRNFQRNQIGSNNLTYGLNLEITTYIDGTNNIIRNAHLFDEIIGLQVTAKVIEAMVFSVRTNVNERNIQNIPELSTLYNELNLARPSEDLPFSVGLRKQIERAVFQAKKAFEENVARLVGIAG